MIRPRARLLVIAAAAVAALEASHSAFAADSLDDLLAQTANLRTEQAKANAAREQEFLARRDQQAKLLADAKRARDAAEARSKALSAQFDANEAKLGELDNLLTQRMGSLGELFGVVRQVAGDGSSALYNSMLSAQFPKRAEFLTGLGKVKSLPSTEELERLWYEILREMAESGRVARWKTEIVDANGVPKQAEVVRIGGFVAMSEGRYLSYLPSVGKLAVLARQPPGALLRRAVALERAKSGYVEAAVDPSRGALLSLIVERPDVLERIRRGQAVGYVILGVGIIGFALALYQAIYLVRTRIAVSRQLASLDRPSDDNPLGRVLASASSDLETLNDDAEVAELRISEAVLREVPRLERFQAFLRLAVAAGPLLGLIGTVIGMIITFQSITESGSSDPRLMANGIGQAMIATVLGLGIAIPLLFANAGLASISRQIVQILDEQSAGLLAESLERLRERGELRSA